MTLLYDNCIALNNIRYWRRDSLICKLPASVAEEDKRRLHQFDIDQQYLFPEDAVKSLEDRIDKRSTRDLLAVALKQAKAKVSPLASSPYNQASASKFFTGNRPARGRRQRFGKKSKRGRGGRAAANSATSKPRGGQAGKQSF